MYRSEDNAGSRAESLNAMFEVPYFRLVVRGKIDNCNQAF